MIIIFLPACFNDYYFKHQDIYLAETRNSKLGCLFQPSRNTTRYGLNSISHKSVTTWNTITKQLKTDLSSLSFHNLKDQLTNIFISKYSPDGIIIGNDLPTPRYNPVPVADIANEIIETGLLCRRYGVQHIFISSVLLRRQFYQQQRCRDLNAFLRDLCVVHNFIFIDNANISVEHLFTDGVHLTDQGSQILCDNYLFYLNSIFDDILYMMLRR